MSPMALVSALSLLGLTANAADVPAPEKPSSKSASVPPFQMRLVAPHAEANTEEMILLGVPESEQKLHVQKAAVLDHASLKDVFVGIQGPGAESTITVVFTLDGTERFAQVTRDNIGERLAIV